MGYSGARGTLIYEKKPEGENLVSDQTPFNRATVVRSTVQCCAPIVSYSKKTYITKKVHHILAPPAEYWLIVAKSRFTKLGGHFIV